MVLGFLRVRRQRVCQSFKCGSESVVRGTDNGDVGPAGDDRPGLRLASP
jgi:hypothetical protein